MTDATLDKGRKLIHLYRRGVGGERTNAGRLLAAHLRSHDLTLYDLDPSLPVTQDVAELEHWRESAALLARLGSADPAEHDELLSRLVDADDLTDTEMTRLLGAVSLEKLVDTRADGWAFTHGGDAEAYRRAGRTVQSADVLSLPGSLAGRLLAATLHAHFVLSHPEKTIRAEGTVQQQFLAGLVESLTGQPGTLVEGGVRARLDAAQLARLRALLAQHSPRAEELALQAAFAYGRSLQ